MDRRQGVDPSHKDDVGPEDAVVYDEQAGFGEQLVDVEKGGCDIRQLVFYS